MGSNSNFCTCYRPCHFLLKTANFTDFRDNIGTQRDRPYLLPVERFSPPFPPAPLNSVIVSTWTGDVATDGPGRADTRRLEDHLAAHHEKPSLSEGRPLRLDPHSFEGTVH